MTPKEKAIELYEKFYSEIEDFDHEHESCEVSARKVYAKKCSLIAVDEILSIFIKNDGPSGSSYINEGKFYWMQVKKELS